jgi:predicted dehydrogenase
VLLGGQSTWHPNPDIFFMDGAGPLLDMGPYYLTAMIALLGPVERVAAFASTRVAAREIEIGPRAGERFTARTPTHTAATLELAGGVTANLVASFEAPGQYVCDLVIHGTHGVLSLPDPNAFDGPVQLRSARQGWEDVPFETRGARDARGIGLHDLACAIAEGRPHRASAELAVHVVDVARTILEAAKRGRTLDVSTTAERPAAMPVAATDRSL